MSLCRLMWSLSIVLSRYCFDRSLSSSIFFRFIKAMPPGKDYYCPCCERGLTDEADVARFQKSMKHLSGVNSILIKVDEMTKIAEVRLTYEKTIHNLTVFVESFLF